jgi:hypothetical protein
MNDAAMANDEELKLRPMTFEGIRYDDDWLVIWRGLTVGRILKQSGISAGSPQWWWGVNFDQRPQGADGKGTGRDLEDCKQKFKVVWERTRRGLTDEDFETAKRNDEEAERRAKGQAYRDRKNKIAR